MIPSLRFEYQQKLKEKRKSLKKKREERKASKQKLDFERSKSTDINRSAAMEPKKNGSLHKSAIQGSSYIQEYEQFHFSYENGKEYLYISYLYNGKKHDITYDVLKKQVEGKEMYLTCKKQANYDNVRYAIDMNPLLDSMKQVRIMKYVLS